MTKINGITAPDVIHNNSLSILIIRPKETTKAQFNSLVEKFESYMNIYLYEPEQPLDTDFSWLLNVSKIVDYTIIDIDYLQGNEKKLAGYFVSLPNTFYLTNDEVTPYNLLSVNRIYNLDWLYETIKEE